MGDFAKSFLAHGINTVGTLALAWFAISQSKVEVEPEYVEILQTEIGNLRRQLSETQAQVLALSIKNADLERQVGGSIEEIELGAVFAYIDAIERPAWCKSIEHKPPNKPVFRMAYLNYAYELVYGVSVDKYMGGTDFDNHPQDVAQAYYENDMQTYREKDYVEFYEPVSSMETYNGERQFAKFWVSMPSGPQFICGIQINNI